MDNEIIKLINQEIMETKRMANEIRRQADITQRQADAAHRQADAAHIQANAAQKKADAAWEGVNQLRELVIITRNEMLLRTRPWWKKLFSVVDLPVLQRSVPTRR